LSASSILELEGAIACCEDERWEPIPYWPHEASSCGRVRSVNRIDAAGRLLLGDILPQHPDRRPGKGYLYVTLRDGKRRRKAAVAVLVLEAHRELRPGPGYEACHNHGVRTDNHLSKLRWDTRKANRADRTRHELERTWTGGLNGKETRGKREEGRGPSCAVRGVTVTGSRNDQPENGCTPPDLRSVTSQAFQSAGRYMRRYTSRRAA
jgi:hypothetical protein